jgi:hypothetical protein
LRFFVHFTLICRHKGPLCWRVSVNHLLLFDMLRARRHGRGHARPGTPGAGTPFGCAWHTRWHTCLMRTANALRAFAIAGENATMRDLALAVRADEASHSHVNHKLSETPQDAPNPFMVVKGESHKEMH